MRSRRRGFVVVDGSAAGRVSQCSATGLRASASTLLRCARAEEVERAATDRASSLSAWARGEAHAWPMRGCRASTVEGVGSATGSAGSGLERLQRLSGVLEDRQGCAQNAATSRRCSRANGRHLTKRALRSARSSGAAFAQISVYDGRRDRSATRETQTEQIDMRTVVHERTQPQSSRRRLSRSPRSKLPERLRLDRLRSPPRSNASSRRGSDRTRSE